MGFLDSLGKAAGWLKDSVPVGQVFDAAMAPITGPVGLRQLTQAMGVSSDAIGKVFSLDDNAYTQAVRPFTTGYIVAGDTIRDVTHGRGGTTEFSPNEWRKAWNASRNVTAPEAALSVISPEKFVGQVVAPFLSEQDRQALYSAIPTADPNFDVTNEKDRKAAFDNTFLGQVESTTVDFAQRWAYDPLNVATLGGAHLNVLRQMNAGKILTSTNVDKALASHNTEDVISWISSEKSRGGDVAARLNDHPALRRSSQGSVIATALADAKDEGQVRDVLGSLYGDASALMRLEGNNEALAARIKLMSMEVETLDKVATIGDPEAIALGFDTANAAVRRDAVMKQLKALVDEKALNDRIIEVPGLYQGERILSYGPKEALLTNAVRHDFYQKGIGNGFLKVVRPAVTMAPHKMVDVNRPSSSVQVERFLRKTQIPINLQDAEMERYMRALTPEERGTILQDIEDKSVSHILTNQYGLPAQMVDQILSAARKGRGSAQVALRGAERRYAGKRAYSVVRINDGAEEVHYPLMASQTTDIVPMVDLDQLHRLGRRYSSTIRTAVAANPAHKAVEALPWVADRFYRLWKPAVLLRPAWPLRVVGDEKLRIIGKLHGMVASGWSKMGQTELDAVAGHEAQKVVGIKKGRFGRTAGFEYAPEEVLPKADSTPFQRLHGRKPIDEEYAAGDVTGEQFISFVKNQATRRGWLPHGYEDIYGAWKNGHMTDDEFAASMKTAAELKHNGFSTAGSDVQRVYDSVLQNDGITYDINTGSVPIRGHAVSTRSDLAQVVDKREFEAIGPSLIRTFIAKNRTELLKPGRALGVWIEGDQAYLDVSRVIKNRETALKVGKEANQIAITDLEKLNAGDFENAFPTTGGDGTYSPTRPGASASVSDEEFRQSQERIAYLTGEAPKPMNYDALKGAYMGKSSWGDYDYSGPFAAGRTPNVFWDLSSARGSLKNLADHYERDGIQQAYRVLKNHASIEPGQPGYERAWEIAVNQQMASDPMAKQFLQGKSYDEVLRWLRSTEQGILHRRTLPVRGQNPEEWVGIVEDMVNSYAPTARLKTLALEQRARFKDLKSEVGKTSALPVVHGEALGTALGSGDFWKWYEGWTGKMFEKLGGMPTDKLSRHPYFATLYHAKVRQVIDTWKNQGLEIGAKQLNNVERMGREYALSETRKLLYDLAEQSDLAKMLRFMSPFYGAWQETLTRWANIAYHNPAVIAKAHLIWDAPNRAGLVYDRNTGKPILDPHSGIPIKDQVIRLRLPKWATKDIPGAQLIPPAEVAQWFAQFGGTQEGVTLSKGGFNLAMGNSPWWLPGPGPTVQIPMNEYLNDHPDIANSAIGKYIMPYGPMDTGSTLGNVINQALPAYMRRLSAIPQGEGNSTYGNMKMRIYLVELAKYNQGLRPQKPTWKEAEWKAKEMYTVWALATWTSPSAIAPISPVDPYVNEYRALVAADAGKDRSDPNYQSPDAIFYEEHGPELFALTGSLTKSADSAPATLGAYKASKKYASLIKQVSDGGSPELAGLLIGSEGAGDFNYSVYQYQLNHDTYPGSGVKERERFTPKQKLAERNAAAGWIQYRKINDNITHELIARGMGPNDIMLKGAQDLQLLKSFMVKKLGNENADWKLDYDQVDRGTMERRITNLRAALDAAPQLRNRQDMEGTVKYLQLRDNIVKELRSRASSGGATTLEAKSNEDLALLWNMLTGQLVEKNLAFQDTFYRYLERDQLSASDKIEGEK